MKSRDSELRKENLSTKTLEDGMKALKIGEFTRNGSVSSSSSSASSSSAPTQLSDIISRAQILKGNPVSVSKAMSFAKPIGQFVTAYVAALIDKNRAILMVPDFGDANGTMIRITKDTGAGETDKSIDCSTLFLTQEVKVYGVVPTIETVADLPTWSIARWIATKIMPCGPIPKTYKTIGFSTQSVIGDKFHIVTDETPKGFLVRRALLQQENKGKQHSSSAGAMFTAYAYQLREGTSINNMSDVNYYISNPEKKGFNSGNLALRQICRATPSEMEMCRSKCHSAPHPSIDDYELYIGKASASMAAFESHMKNVGLDRFIFKASSKMKLEPSGVYTTKFSFPCRSWEEGISDVWAAGLTTMAVFRGTRSYKTPVDITSFEIRDDRGFATVQFSRSATEFLTSWTKFAGRGASVQYGPITEKDENAFDAIRNGFMDFVGTSMFKQYAGVEKPIQSTQKLSEKQKKVGEFELDEFQTKAMETILFSDGISLTQAPPGSGKTVLVAAVARELLLGDEANTIIITGTTNIAVDNALSTLAGMTEDSKDFRSVRIASQRAMCLSADLEMKETQHEKAMNFEKHIKSAPARKVLTGMRTEAVSRREKARRTPKTANEVVNKYAEVKEAETVLGEKFTGYFGPNLIATTTSLLLRNSSKSAFANVTHIIIDEASQLIPTELLAILSAFPMLKKLAIIGDEFQLQPYSDLEEDSDARICFGTADLIRLNKEFGGTATKLRRIYRSHPKMTKNLINSFYPYQLEAGAKAEDRTMATRLKLPTCDDDTPVRAYNVNGVEISGGNQMEATAILQFVRTLISKGVQPEEILVLAFHCNQRSHLCTILPKGVRVKTIDSAQGQQSPITIVATTKSCESYNAKSVIRTMRFISDKNRGTVALSRGLQATYIFGNLKQLEMTPFWGPVIKKLRSLNGTSNTVPGSQIRKGSVGSNETNQPSSSRIPSLIKLALIAKPKDTAKANLEERRRKIRKAQPSSVQSANLVPQQKEKKVKVTPPRPHNPNKLMEPSKLENPARRNRAIGVTTERLSSSAMTDSSTKMSDRKMQVEKSKRLQDRRKKRAGILEKCIVPVSTQVVKVAPPKTNKVNKPPTAPKATTVDGQTKKPAKKNRKKKKTPKAGATATANPA